MATKNISNRTVIKETQFLDLVQTSGFHSFQANKKNLDFERFYFEEKLVNEINVVALIPVRKIFHATDCDSVARIYFSKLESLKRFELGDIVGLRSSIVKLKNNSIHVVVNISREDIHGNIEIISNVKLVFITLQNGYPRLHKMRLNYN